MTKRHIRVPGAEHPAAKLGSLIETPQKKDAIHIAIAPVKAGEKLFPAQHVGIAGGKAVVCKETIGIVDPFLMEPVYPDADFWLVLYPGSITSLRHDWEHPAFPDVPEKPIIGTSEQWLRDYAEEVGLSYAIVMEAASNYIAYGDYHTFGYDTPDCVYTRREQFWEHYEIVTGTKVADHQATFFSCAC